MVLFNDAAARPDYRTRIGTRIEWQLRRMNKAPTLSVIALLALIETLVSWKQTWPLTADPAPLGMIADDWPA
ncbi:MAG TPA: hypothetical protein VNF29_04625 [Candidatus Binataceae bacterium]|nr:hypothetical protein [Candidatus Binataceae bacterium]